MPFVKPREQVLRRLSKKGSVFWEPFYETRYNVLRREGYEARTVMVDALIPALLGDAPVTTVLLARRVDPDKLVEVMPVRAPALKPREKSPDKLFSSMWRVYEQLSSGLLDPTTLSPVDREVLGVGRGVRRLRIAFSILAEILEEGLGFRGGIGVSVAFYRLVYYPLLVDRNLRRVYDLYTGHPSSIYTKLMTFEKVRDEIERGLKGL